jgi:hypothetical protein
VHLMLWVWSAQICGWGEEVVLFGDRLQAWFLGGAEVSGGGVGVGGVEEVTLAGLFRTAGSRVVMVVPRPARLMTRRSALITCPHIGRSVKPTNGSSMIISHAE